MLRAKVKSMLKMVVTMSMLVVLTAVPVFATTAKTVEVKGYVWEGITDEELKNTESNFSVTNVVEVYDSDEIEETYNDGLIVQGGTVVTLLHNAACFDAYVVMEQDGKRVYSEDNKLEIVGKVEINVYDKAGHAEEKVIDAKDLDKYDVMFYTYLKGCTVNITKPGDYYICLRKPVVSGAAEAIVTVKEGDIPESEEVAEDKDNSDADNTEEQKLNDVEGVMSESISTTVDHDHDSNLHLTVYKINDVNYYKLRDIAKLVSGTTKQFDVTWDNENKVVNLISNHKYTEVGGEFAKVDTIKKSAKVGTSKIKFDGKEINLNTYLIENNNFVKIDDIAKLIDFKGWEDCDIFGTLLMEIQTPLGYDDELLAC